jgi:diguanylate cyclase (GGDEF)-like protein
VGAVLELALLLFVGPLAIALALAARLSQRQPRDPADQLDRLQVAVHRIARSLEDGLDSEATLDVALGTVVEAVGAAAGRARLAGTFKARTFEPVPPQPGARDAEALLTVERAALFGRSEREFHGGWWALGAPLLARRERDSVPIGALAVCRRGMPFRRDEEDLLEFIAAQASLSLEAIAMHERLVALAVRDELTGLGNHRHFQEALEALVDAALASESPLSILLVDMDDFRGVNARFGHAVGDAVLRAVGELVRRRCRMVDEAARYAGQQIAVALPGIDLDGACTVADEIRSDIAALDLRGGTLKVIASIGIVELSDRVTSRQGLIFAVEEALDEAKRAGKNHIAGWLGGARAHQRR